MCVELGSNKEDWGCKFSLGAIRHRAGVVCGAQFHKHRAGVVCEAQKQ